MDVRNVQLPQPWPQCSVVHTVKRFREIQVAAEEGPRQRRGSSPLLALYTDIQDTVRVTGDSGDLAVFKDSLCSETVHVKMPNSKS